VGAHHDKRLLNQLRALVRASWAFNDPTKPVLWADVSRVGRTGLTLLAKIYGEDSRKVAGFSEHWQQAFIAPMSLREGCVRRPGWNVIDNFDPADFPGGQHHLSIEPCPRVEGATGSIS
jgi:hypothetical protein